MGLINWLFGSEGERSCSSYPEGVNEDIARKAALRLVSPLPEVTPAWLGGTLEECARGLAGVDRRRSAFENYEPSWMRHQIMGWLDYAENKIKEEEDDIRVGRSKRRQEQYRVRTRSDDEKVSRLLRSLKDHTSQ